MTFSSKLIALFALIILMFIGTLSIRNTAREAEDRGWVVHTHLVLEKVQQILIDVSQTESGQRGYILTGEDSYLNPYRNGVTQAQQDVAQLRELTSDNPTQQEATRHLDQFILARFTGLGERIEIRRRNGLTIAAEAVATGDNGEERTDEIRICISQIQQAEERLLSLRLSAAAASTRNIKLVIILGNALEILFLSIAGLAIHRETRRSNLAERELQQANEILKHRTNELSDANGELESFSYSVAHDLRAPLRQIAGYSSVLLQDYGQRLDAEARRSLDKVAAGARKMGQLLDDLLSFSRIGRQELLMQSTPLDSLLRQVVEDLAPECSARNIDWQIGKLFVAECDAGLIKQVFVNLLSNAVKYSGKREHAVIQVGETTQNNEHVIFVRDNGAGFEMQYVNKLFGVFQRLHKARDFEGTGVGLAIVQRIIAKHGGRIWAEAKLDQGATFFFTLGSPEIHPAREPEPAIHGEVIHAARS
ncbi:MAG: CHASE3 domain-containing protein [Candidatus Sulfotelmatobacter sp.]